MLGKLAKWLRIAGFDVLYSNRYTDDELLEVADRDGRILLSRDTRLLVRRSARQFVFLESERVQEQIRQVFRLIGVSSLSAMLSRCIRCNEVLSDVSPEKVRAQVPPYVFDTQSVFKFCVRCQRVYWAGTHRQSVLRTLEKLLE
jgi:uncharacterized protein